MRTLYILLIVTASLEELDEEILLKNQLFRKYDSNVIQNRWRKTFEQDLREWSTDFSETELINLLRRDILHFMHKFQD